MNLSSSAPYQLFAFTRMRLNQFASSSLRCRVVAGAFWSVAGAVISRALGLASSVLLARLLGQAAFGELGTIQATVGMFGVFAGLGLGLAANKYVSEYKTTHPEKAASIISLSFRIAFASGSVLMFLIFGFAGFLAEALLKAPHLAPALKMSALLVFGGALVGAQNGALSGFEAFKAIATNSFYSGLLTFPMALGGAYLAGVTGAVAGLCFSQFVTLLLNHVSLRREFRKAGIEPSAAAGTKEWSTIWRFGLPATLSNLLIIPVNWVASLMLVQQSNGYSEMGLYNAANQWRTAILFLPISLSGSMLPLLSNLAGQGDGARYKKVFTYHLVFIGVAALLPALLISLCSHWILQVYGPGFQQGRDVLILMVLTAVFMAVNHIQGGALASAAQMWAGVMANLSWAVALLTFAFLLVPGKGALGLAWATLLSYPLQSLVLWLSLRRNVLLASKKT